MSQFDLKNTMPDGAIPEPQALGKVAVLMGGDSSEREISLMSGGGVLQALRPTMLDRFGLGAALEALVAQMVSAEL